MSWLYERWTMTSELNGLIECHREFGQWTIEVQGIFESGPYMIRLWKQALKKVPRDAKVKRILMLGLAGGACVNMLHKRFPECHITAIEWDPVMIEIMHRVRMMKKKYAPEILVGDAAELVPKLAQRFDLVVFDLFRGPTIPDQVTQKHFFEALQKVVNPRGYVLTNVFRQPEVLERIKFFFGLHSRWTFRTNTVALFRPFGNGGVGEPLPTSYLNFRSCPGFIGREYPANVNPTALRQGPALGLRQTLGPFAIDKFFGEHEPVLEPHTRPRMVIWQPVTRQDTPAGWHRSWVQTNARKTGFVDLEQPGALDGTAWASHAQRHLHAWNARTEWIVDEPSLEEFIAAYRKAPLRRSLINLHIRILQEKRERHGDLLQWIAARRMPDGPIEAGFCFLHVPESRQSIHIMSFLHRSAHGTPVAVGLVHDWFVRAAFAELRFADFDLFYAPGDPKQWRGFSRFKSQFGTHFITYPNPLMRFMHCHSRENGNPAAPTGSPASPAGRPHTRG